MIIALNVLFWSWCAWLAVIGGLFIYSARADGGDATAGAGEFLMGLAAFALLAASLIVRALAWWLL